MFTGIIEILCRVKEMAPARGILILEIEIDGLKPGESSAVNGNCLTAGRISRKDVQFDLSPETCGKTTVGSLRKGQSVNIERALKLGDRIGGHLVTGHVDGKGRIVSLRQTGAGKEMTVVFPTELKKYIVLKGSIVVEGVSLTVAGVSGNRFSVALVPYTLQRTTLGEKRIGDGVNIEVDIIARYLK